MGRVFLEEKAAFVKAVRKKKNYSRSEKKYRMGKPE